jgi:galactonate dehydratase
MKIDRLRVFMSRDKDRPRVIVAMDTDDGITGWGECYNHGPDLALFPLLDYLLTFLKGKDPRRIAYLIHYLMQQTRFPPGALGLAAISALDHCMWDISAKALGVPVYMLLGGNVRDRVKVYAGLYTAPDPAAARDQMDALHGTSGASARSSSAPTASTSTATAGARWCAPRPSTSGSCARPCAPTTNWPSTPTPRSSRSARRCNWPMRWRPTTRCSSRSRCGPRTSRPGANSSAACTCTLATGESLYSRFEFQRLLAAAHLRHHPARHLRGRRRARDVQDRRTGRNALRDHRAAQPDGAAGHRDQRAFQRGADQLPHPRIPPAARAGLCVRHRQQRGRADRRAAGSALREGPVPAGDGYLELRPDRPGWGVEMDEELLGTEEYIHWERKVPVKPDGATGYA